MIIAQAAHESSWGRSAVFETELNLFGHSCPKGASKGKKITMEFDFQNQPFEVNSSCERYRGKGCREGGYYVRFESAIDSILAYAFNLTSNPKTSDVYSKIRTALAHTRETQTPADSGTVAPTELIYMLQIIHRTIQNRGNIIRNIWLPDYFLNLFHRNF